MSGIIMLSPLLEGSLTFDGNQLALGAALQLPSMAAAELEHRKAFSKEALAEIERFALTDYLTILAGPSPIEGAAQSFYAHVAQLTGLPVDVVRRTRGFVRKSYIKHVREQGQAIVSAYDASFAAPDAFPEFGLPMRAPIRSSKALFAPMEEHLQATHVTNWASRLI